MSENNTNIKINEDIYNKFYNTLLVKKFQLRKANRKYRINNRDRVNMIQNKASKKYYINTPGLKEKIKHFRRLRYQTDEDFKNKTNILTLNYYNSHKEEILKKSKIKIPIKEK